MPFTRARRLSLGSLEPREVPATLAGLSSATVAVAPDGGGPPVVRLTDVTSGQTVASLTVFESTFTGGVHAALGDVTGDGVPDLVVAPGAGGAPRVRVIDGATGNAVADFYTYETSYTGGVYMALGDVNGDGRADIVTGTGDGGGPRVRVLDGATLGRTVLKDFFAYEPDFRGGVQVAAGDVDGDGKSDVVTGTGVGGGPRVRVFDAVSNLPVRDFLAYEADFRGGVQVSAADLTGDGRAEIVTGAGVGGGPVVRSFSSDGQPLASVVADDPAARAGVRVAATSAGVAAILNQGGQDVVRLLGGTMLTARGATVSPVGGPSSPTGGTVAPATDGSASSGGTTSDGAVGGSSAAVSDDAPPEDQVFGTGTVTVVDTAASTLTLSRNDGSGSLVVKLAYTTVVERNGAPAALKDIQLGDAVQARISADGAITKVEAFYLPKPNPYYGGSSPSSLPALGPNAHVQGVVFTVNEAAGELTIHNSFGVTFRVIVSDQTKVLRNGQPASPKDIQPGDQAEAWADDKAQVTRVEATGA